MIQQLKQKLYKPKDIRNNNVPDDLKRELVSSCSANLEKYFELVSEYGSFSIDEFFWVLNPCTQNSYLNILHQINTQNNFLLSLDHDIVKSGLLSYTNKKWTGAPIAITDNGDLFYIIEDGIFVILSRAPDYLETRHDIISFISMMCEDISFLNIFPDDFVVEPSGLISYE